MSQLIEKNKAVENQKPTILVIDDAYAGNLKRQQSIVRNIGLPGVDTMFVGSCQEAIETLERETNIIFCLLDCMLPENRNTMSSFNPKEEPHIRGLKIIDTLINIRKEILIAVYSAYVGEIELENHANLYKSNVVAHFQKEQLLDIIKVFIRKIIVELGLNLDTLEKSEETKTKYDYNLLEPEARILIQKRTEQIQSLVRRSAENIINIGRYLVDVRENLKHGQFIPWLNSEFDWSKETAYRFISVYEKFKFVNLTNLNLAPTVLYQLSSAKIPSSAIDEVIRLARTGKAVTVKEAQLIKKKYTQKQDKPLSDLQSFSSPDNNLETIPSNLSDQDNNKLENFSKSTVEPTINSIPRQRSIFEIEKPLEDIKPQQILKVIPQRQNRWQIGKRQHTIVCADPNSDLFKKLLPSKAALVLSFPIEKNWNFSYTSYDSINTFQTQHEDLDDKGILDAVKNIIEVTTGSDDIVILAYIPHYGILSLLDNLGCRSFVAEPNYDKCIKLVEASKTLM